LIVKKENPEKACFSGVSKVGIILHLKPTFVNDFKKNNYSLIFLCFEALHKISE